MTTCDHAATAPWAGIQSKPAEFPPAAHRHIVSDLERSGAEVGDIITFDGKRWVAQAPSNKDFLVAAGEALASYKEELTLIADSQQSLVRKTTAIVAKFGESEARFNESITALAKANEASVIVARDISARLADAQARIRRVDEVVVTRESALARTTEELSAKIADNSANITTIKSSYATRTFAEAKKTEAITASTANTSAMIVTSLVGYATETFAEAKKTEAITAAAADATAKVTVETTARTTSDTALATRATNLEATVNNGVTGVVATYARVVNEETARANADTALATNITGVVAAIGAKVKVQGVAPATPALNDVWIDTSDSNKAKYWDGAAWQYKQDGVLYAAITDEATVRATKDGYLSGMRVIGVDAGGRVTGMKITAISDPAGWGTTSEISFNAGVFKIYNDAGTSVAPFTVAGGIVYLTNAVAETLKASISITTPTIIGGTFKMDGNCTICSTTYDGADASILRFNGGGGDGQGRGGQVDVLGNEYTTVAGYNGSVLITPGNHGYGTVRLRDRTGTDRLVIDTDGSINLGSNAEVLGIVRTHDGTTGAPAYSFLNETNTGMNRRATGGLGFVVAGSERLVIRSGATVILEDLKLSKNVQAVGGLSVTGYIDVLDAGGNTVHLAVLT